MTASRTTSSKLATVAPDRSDVVVLFVIAVLGIAAAIVCFGLLKSEAKTSGAYPLSGAILGLLLVWSALGSLYLNLRRDTREFGDLQRENRELGEKLLRSAPRPLGFELEVDEHQRIVLARPHEWERGGGTIFDYQLSAASMEKDDIFPARFALHFRPLSDDLGAGEFYSQAKSYYDDYLLSLGATYTSEMVHVGGPEGFASLKFSAQAYARVALPTDDSSDVRNTRWDYVDRAEFRKHVSWFVEKAIAKRLEHLPKDLDAVERMARAKETLVPYVERALEKWEVDPTRGINPLIESLLDEHGDRLLGDVWRDGADGAEGSPASAAAGTSPAGLGVEGLQPRPREGGGDAADSARRHHEQREVILPVGRMIVLCCHPGLRKVYTFDFVDNASDYATASETFNRVLASVRFLV